MEPTRAGAAGRTARVGVPWLLYAYVVLIVAVIAAAEAGILLAFRDITLHQATSQLDAFSRAFAEEVDRSLLALDRTLGDIADRMEAEAGSDPAALGALIGDVGSEQDVQQRLSALPHVLTIGLLDSSGRVVSGSRSWLSPGGATSERDYVRALRDAPLRQTAIGAPFPNRDGGGWGLPVAHRIRTGENGWGGIVVGIVDLRWFESLFHAMAPPAAMRLSLQRDDGATLLRQSGGVEDPVATGPAGIAQRPVAPAAPDRVIAVRRPLPDFPLSVTVSESRSAALQPWRAALPTLLLGGGGIGLLLGGVILAIGWHWQARQTAMLRRAETAEAEREAAIEAAGEACRRERLAEAVSRQRSGLLAMMSHEIRTPMNAVLGLAGTLLDAPLAPQQRSVVSAIRESGDSLLRLLNDILDFSKLDAGRMTLEAAPFSPQLVTHNPVSILGPRAAAKGLTIDATCAEEVPPALLGDAGRIRQVLLNLVSNAVKFTTRGGVRIEACCPARTETQATVTWTISDTGIGIPADRVDRLFDDFVQTDSTIARRFGGTGLGLAISKRLVDRMGGTIAVSSTPGKGTSVAVTLTLPLATLTPASGPVSTDAARLFLEQIGALGRPLRILFAEDNPTDQLVALHLLKGLPVQVDVVADGLEAIDAAGTFLYDLICMDVRMPEMDGLQATRLIRRRGGRLADVPIIALTADAFPEDVRDCFDAGMTGFVSKPVMRDAFLTAVVQAMAGSKALRRGWGTGMTGLDQLAPRPTIADAPASAGAGPSGISGRGDPGGDALHRDGEPAARAPGPAALAGIGTGASATAEACDTPAQAPAPDAVVLDLDPVAAARLAQDVGEDGRAEMFALFTAETEARLGRLASGRLEPATLLREVHSLKGAGATVCASRLSRRAADLEARLRGNGTIEPADIAGLSADFAAWREAGKQFLTAAARAL